MKRLYLATLNSLRGFRSGIATEAALREESLLLVAGALLGMFLAPSLAWYLAMVSALLILLAIEFLNTAVEKLADYVTIERHVEIRRVKDFGSAAVFCAILVSGLIWLAAIAQRLMGLISL